MSRIVPAGRGGDTRTYYKTPAFLANTIGSTPGSIVTAKTAAYTLSPRELDCAFSNAGASGAVTFTLPTMTGGETIEGHRLWFFKKADQTMTITAPTGYTINVDDTSLANSTTIGTSEAMICLIGSSGTNWTSHSATGTWA